MGKNYGIYWIKLWIILGKSYEFIMGYSGQKLWDILGNKYGIYSAKTMG